MAALNPASLCWDCAKRADCEHTVINNTVWENDVPVYKSVLTCGDYKKDAEWGKPQNTISRKKLLDELKR